MIGVETWFHLSSWANMHQFTDGGSIPAESNDVI